MAKLTTFKSKGFARLVLLAAVLGFAYQFVPASRPIMDEAYRAIVHLFSRK